MICLKDLLAPVDSSGPRLNFCINNLTATATGMHIEASFRARGKR